MSVSGNILVFSVPKYSWVICNQSHLWVPEASIPANIHICPLPPFLSSWSLLMLPFWAPLYASYWAPLYSSYWQPLYARYGRGEYFLHAENIFSYPLIISYVSMYFYHIYPHYHILPLLLNSFFFPTSFLPIFMSFFFNPTCWVWLDWPPHPIRCYSRLVPYRSLGNINSYTTEGKKTYPSNQQLPTAPWLGWSLMRRGE